MSGDFNKGILHSFLFYSGIISVIIFISVLKPHRIYKKVLSIFFNKTFKFNNADWKIYHLLIIVIIFYGLIFAFLRMELGNYHLDENDSMDVRMTKLGQKWKTETNLWLITLILVCLLSLYKNASLFTKEAQIQKELDDITKQLEESKKK
jgi:membrane protease YdiL (CAAX protease family)